MWTAYPDYKHTVEDWLVALNDKNHSTAAHTLYCLNRALRRAARDSIITREEQQSLWGMLRASDEDKYLALKALETKYNK